jgi:RNA-directed DNA polymerase
MLPSYHSRLGTVRDGKFFPTIRFLNYSRLVHDVMQLGGGAGDLKHLITGYRKMMKLFKHKPLSHPVIVLVDNDDGAGEVFSAVKAITEHPILHATADPFFHVCEKLYLVKTRRLQVASNHVSRTSSSLAF